MRTASQIIHMKNELGSKNSYMTHFKKRPSNQENFYVFDQAMRDKKGMGEHHELVKPDRTTRAGDPQGRGFCQKCKRESLWCKERKCREEPTKTQRAPLTSSQVVGWRQPIDNLMSLDMGMSTFNRSGVCWRTFHDNGHI